MERDAAAAGLTSPVTTESRRPAEPADGVTCPLCDAKGARLHHDQGYRRLLKCRSCRIVFADPFPGAEEKYEIERQAYEGELLPEAAEFFANCHRNFKEDAVIRSFRAALEWIGATRSPGSLLDVGPGTGVFLHLAREAGWTPFGLDLCELSAEKALEEFGLRIDVGDFLGSPYERGQFDAITMLDVLEHTPDPRGFLARALDLLKPGGVVYIAVPNQRCLLTLLVDTYIKLGLPHGHWFLERLYVRPHLLYFNPVALQAALARAGFDVAGIRGGNVYLGRYRLPLGARIPLEIVLRIGGLLGMSAKIHVLARKPARAT